VKGLLLLLAFSRRATFQIWKALIPGARIHQHLKGNAPGSIYIASAKYSRVLIRFSAEQVPVDDSALRESSLPSPNSLMANELAKRLLQESWKDDASHATLGLASCEPGNEAGGLEFSGGGDGSGEPEDSLGAP
jgi:hypothetical protein